MSKFGRPASVWRTAPISRKCEVLCYVVGEAGVKNCGKPTTNAYPALGGGWMALCLEHGLKHGNYALSIESLLAKGETLADP